MNVVYVVGQNAGGLPHYTAELANALADSTTVTVIKPDASTADDLFDDGVDVRNVLRPLNLSMPKLYNLQFDPMETVRGIASYNNLKIIHEIEPDIIHDTTGLFPNVRLFLKVHGIDETYPVLSTRHEVPVTSVPLSRPAVLAENVVNSVLPEINEAHTIVHTEKQRQAMLNHGTDPGSITVIPHGSYSIFGTYSDIDRPPEPNCLLFFGNIIPPKGLETLVEAVPMVKTELPDVKLIIAGDGTIPDRVWKTIIDHRENFEIHNYFVPNEEVSDLFARAELAVMPYHFQGGTKGHSGALATAYSFGTPVVASTAGEFFSMVHESGCGKVVPPRNPRKLAAAITKILTNPDLKDTMKENCLQMAENLSWENIAERHYTLYRHILTDEPPLDRSSSERALPSDDGNWLASQSTEPGPHSSKQ